MGKSSGRKKVAELLHQDKNLLKDPLWFVNANQFEDNDSSLAVWCNRAGYKFMTSKEPPNRSDYLVLLGVLYLSQCNGWSIKIETTRHKLIKLSGLGVNSASYKRIERALERYTASYIKNENWFIPGEGYSTQMWNIISSVELRKRKVIVYLTPAFLDKIKTSNFFERLDLGVMKDLKSPIALRLYELLSSMFYRRSEWSICAMKLASKLSINEQYPSKVVYRLKSFLSTIRKKTGLKVYMSQDKAKRGKIILHFHKKEGPYQAKEASARRRPSTVPQVQHNENDLCELKNWLSEFLQAEQKMQHFDYVMGKIEKGYAGSKELGYDKVFIEGMVEKLPS